MSADSSRHTNRLAHETSPYLLQHAHNPVDWHPWGPEALERARREDKPILLSIGYAACHWCHVMERESFENEAVARVMNEHFVCIKVDREERPDLDDIYMAATVALSGHGGWPMTVFLTPEQQPFFAGTYFPPDDKQGRPGFTTLLTRIRDLWHNGRADLLRQAAELTEHVRGSSANLPESSVTSDAIEAAARQLAATFDPEHGGFGDAPKFPASASLALLLRLHRRLGDEGLLQMVTITLDAMKNGGIYDHVGGGFARYSVDERWLVPHFEKMLYDNAQLARIYLETFQVTGSAEYRRVAQQTLDYIAHEMQGPEGGYYSATDADSEGVEGKFFVWTPDQIEEVLGRPATEWFCAAYDVTPEGNFEGTSIPNTPRPFEEVARELGVQLAELTASLAESRKKLYAARLRRVPPLTDDKVLASWNGLMIGAMAEGARVLQSARYLDSAERAARFVLRELARSDGGLYRTARAGKAHLDAYLEDYAFLADGLLDLYEAGASEAFLRESVRLAERMIADFAAPDGGAFFHTAHGHEALIARPREGHDGAIPNANAVAARVLARLAFHLDRDDLRERALAAIRAYGRSIERAPRAFATTLGVVDLLLEGPVELATVGKPGEADTDALLAEVAKYYLPNRIVAHAEPGATGAVSSELPLLVGKTLVSGGAALYVCRDFACQAPVTAPEDVARVLGEVEQDLGASRVRAVGVERLPGHATPEATQAHAELHSGALGAGAYVSLGGTGLTASRLGFGTYRVDDRVEEHRAALEQALLAGVNLIDTSTNYGDGHSERLIGEVLAELHRSDRVPRSAAIVISKIGYAQGENLELAQAQEEAGHSIPEMVKVDENLWHCMHPDWIEDQLGRSLERLSLESLDGCLLHNPEYFLGQARKQGMSLEAAREEFYRRLTEAFRKFEAEIARGRLRFYGVSSNSAGAPSGDVEATSLSRMLEAARAAGGDAHHFRILQLPLNLLEAGPALEKSEGSPPVETVLEHARSHGVAVLVNRPLNAIVEGRVIRLADPPEFPDGPAFGAQLARVKELEAEFAKTIAPSIQLAKESGARPDRLFRWAEQLGDFVADLQSLEQWRDVEAHAVAPRIMQTIGALERGIQGPLAAPWHAWQERYIHEIDALFGAIRKRAADRSRRRSLAVARAIDPLLPAERRAAPLSQKALHVLASAPGVTTVLVGMRSPDYVRDAVTMMGWSAIPDAAKVLDASKQAEVV